MAAPTTLPGGAARRIEPAGLRGGARRHGIDGPAEALALVGPALDSAEARLRTLIGGDVGALPHIAGYLADAGGKRLRPALSALGHLALGEPAVPESVVTLMACGELIHLGSLLHDDVVDDGVTRRGQPAAHVLHGNAVAVLTGDFCVGRALSAALDAGGLDAGRWLARTVAEMSEGEVLQLQRRGLLDTDRDTYLDVIDRKSASLIGWCAAAAAWRAHDAQAAAALDTYGRCVGRAYQITDDVLDYADRTGKPSGADLRERKVTLPLMHAMHRVPGLRTRLEAGPPSDADLPDLIAGVRDSGALRAALDEAHAYVDRAEQALAVLPDTPGREALAVLGRYIVERTA